eukprot:gene50897-62249_t
MGADDYLPKPFNPRELLARIQAMVRRQRVLGAHTGPRQAGGRIVFGAFTLWLDERRLERNDGNDDHGAQDVPLTTGEFALLQALAQQPHRPLGRDRLIALAYGPDHTATDRSIDVQDSRLRREIDSALAGLALLSKDRDARAKALATLREDASAAKLPLYERALAAETETDLRSQLSALVAGAKLSSTDAAQRKAAAIELAGSADPTTRALLLERMSGETDAATKAAMKSAIDAIGDRLAWGERAQLLFSGLSLGSVLLLVALGLAITYGLMGVINM